MSNLDMKEAIRLLAGEKNISEETLLQVLVDALATAYKRRPGAAEEVEVGLNPDTLEISFTAYDIDEDGNWVNPRDDTPEKNELGRIAAQTFRQVMGQRIRFFEACAAGVMCPIGQGVLDYDGIRQALAEIGYQGYITVEQERDPRHAGSVLADVKASRDFLRGVGFH